MARAESTPETKRRRSIFAVLRICQIALFVTGLGLTTLPFSVPQRTGRLHQELFQVLWATPGTFVIAGIALLLFGTILQLIAKPLKTRWARDLKGWIT